MGVLRAFCERDVKKLVNSLGKLDAERMSTDCSASAFRDSEQLGTIALHSTNRRFLGWCDRNVRMQTTFS